MKLYYRIRKWLIDKYLAWEIDYIYNLYKKGRINYKELYRREIMLRKRLNI